MAVSCLECRAFLLLQGCNGCCYRYIDNRPGMQRCNFVKFIPAWLAPPSLMFCDFGRQEPGRDVPQPWCTTAEEICPLYVVALCCQPSRHRCGAWSLPMKGGVYLLVHNLTPSANSTSSKSAKVCPSQARFDLEGLPIQPAIFKKKMTSGIESVKRSAVSKLLPCRR